ncbi:MAG TPA: hypothetical protein VER03_04900 [Bryobacteraceae bacterium]|nr:hypothetical protein [Bryobacteraceae bacterium]
MVEHFRSPKVFAAAALLTVLVTSQCARRNGPQATGASSVRPSELLAQNPPKPAPALTGSGDAARRSVLEFLSWAGASTPGQREEARVRIAAAASNPDIVNALTSEITSARTRDHSRALLALSILGEMRSQYALPYLRSVLREPLPQPGRLIEGEDPNQTAFAILQGKAASGLAYLNNADSNAEVFWAVANHASRIVRAEAIRAYLENHNNSGEARESLRRYVRKGEEIFLDRPNRGPGERGEVFNRRLDAYLQAHQELTAPAPDRGSGAQQGRGGSNFDAQPPRF